MLIYTLPVLAALTGWITNYLAIKMLFHPRKKINLGFWSLQGIFPKRQHLLAEKLGIIVANELFSINDITKRFTNTSTALEINRVLDDKLEDFIEQRLKDTVPLFRLLIGTNAKQKIKNTMHQEFQNILPDILNHYSEKIERDIDVRAIVSGRVSAFSSSKLEKILYSIMQKEFRFIELVGALLGLVIGMIQLFLLHLQQFVL
jgi:uncharacterized membrane protein YheB (UPF0754 family)